MAKSSYGRRLRAPASSAADIRHFDLALFRRFRGPDLRVAVIARAPYGGDGRADFRVRLAPAQQGAKVVTRSGEQAGIEHALGGDAGAGAGAAERLGHRGDDADFAGAVAVAPALGDFARVIGIDRVERQVRTDHADDLARRNHVVHAPAVGRAHVHELDEAQDVARVLEPARHRQDRMLVHAAFHHHVYFYRREAGRVRGVDAC